MEYSVRPRGVLVEDKCLDLTGSITTRNNPKSLEQEKNWKVLKTIPTFKVGLLHIVTYKRNPNMVANFKIYSLVAKITFLFIRIIPIIIVIRIHKVSNNLVLEIVSLILILEDTYHIIQ